MFVKSFVICILFALTFAEKCRFDNYSLYKINPKTKAQVRLIQNLYKDNGKYDFWNIPGDESRYVNVLSSPEDKGYLERFLKEHDIPSEVTNSDIQKEFDKEQIGNYVSGNPRNLTWTRYYNLDDINKWLDDLIRTHSEASQIIGGVSHEGRSIKGIKISHGPGRRAVFVEGGIHAREWISPATVNYITYQLLYSSNEDIKSFARDYDWYIFPVTNPDGYIWTFEENRLWRKNRRPIGEHIGVDLNRNWNHDWLRLGSSDDPSRDTYAGPGPFSEIETRSLSAYMMDLADRMEMYLSFHSFGQMLLVPFGNTTEHLANYDDTVYIGRHAINALEARHGSTYTLGNIAETIYLATGGSIDWAKERLHTPLVYCYELRDRTTFVLPEDQILPNNEEVMDSLVEMIKQAQIKGYMKKP